MLRLVPAPVDAADTRLVRVPNDLPPRWDGRVVVWSEWRLANVGSLQWHAELAAIACSQCGSLDPRYWGTTGSVALADQITREQIEAATAAGKGGRYALRYLVLSRCIDCGHDTVFHMETGDLWDLEPDDYSDDGSTE